MCARERSVFGVEQHTLSATRSTTLDEPIAPVMAFWNKHNDFGISTKMSAQ